MLQAGNKKLDRSILIYSQTPGKSCPNCKGCFKTCYAMKSYRMYPNVKTAWDRNFRLAKTKPVAWRAGIENELKRTKKRVVRIMGAGDFFSQDHVDLWTAVAKAHPDFRFYGYTKTDGLFDFSALKALPNVNIVSSVLPDGSINYGPASWVSEKAKETGFDVCPITAGTLPKTAKCGRECTLCMEKQHVLFVIH